MSTRFSTIADIAGAEDWDYDPWGTATGLHFDIAAVLDMSDVEGDVSPEPFARWQYRRAAIAVPAIETVAARADRFSEDEGADDYSYGTVELAFAYQNGDITQADLIYAGDVLSRYSRLLERAGRSY